MGPNFQRNYSLWSTSLRAALLDGYDKISPPISTRLVDYSEAGTDVTLNIRFFKIEGVDQSGGTMSIKVWWRMRWDDERLAWDPSAYGGVTKLSFAAADSTDLENTEIWAPDVQPYNAKSGLMNTLEPARATVTHTGHVYWARPGSLTVLCRFSGLVAYPFDELSCPLEVGGWIAGGGTQGLRSWPSEDQGGEGCASLPSNEETAMQTYSELSISSVSCYQDEYNYACCPNDPYPVIRYRVTLRRAAFYYGVTLIILMLFTLLSFSVFFMSFAVGERLGVGVTLVLTIEFARGSLAATLPICGEWLWIEIFVLINYVFAIISLLESCVVLAIAFNERDHLLPANVHKAIDMLQQKLRAVIRLITRCGRPSAARVADEPGSVGEGAARGKQVEYSVAAAFFNKQRRSNKDLLSAISDFASVATTVAASTAASATASAANASASVFVPLAPWATTAATNADSTGAASAPVGPSKQLTPSDASKLLFFENLFFRLDVDGGGTIEFEEVRRVLAFTALDMPSEERERHLRAADTISPDGALDRYEFLDLCVNMLWNQSLESLEAAASSYAEFREALKRRSNTYWRAWAHYIDRQSRFWIPLAWASTTSGMFGLNLKDDYNDYSINAVNASNRTYEGYQVIYGAHSSAPASGANPMYTAMGEGLHGMRLDLGAGAVFGIVLFSSLALLRLLGEWRDARQERLRRAASRNEDNDAKRIAQYASKGRGLGGFRKHGKHGKHGNSALSSTGKSSPGTKYEAEAGDKTTSAVLPFASDAPLASALAPAAAAEAAVDDMLEEEFALSHASA